MPMTVLETKISNDTVVMTLANASSAESATAWIGFGVPVGSLMLDQHNPLGEPASRHLASVQRAALHYVREAISDEIQRLSTLLR